MKISQENFVCRYQDFKVKINANKVAMVAEAGFVLTGLL